MPRLAVGDPAAAALISERGVQLFLNDRRLQLESERGIAGLEGALKSRAMNLRARELWKELDSRQQVPYREKAEAALRKEGQLLDSLKVPEPETAEANQWLQALFDDSVAIQRMMKLNPALMQTVLQDRRQALSSKELLEELAQLRCVR